MRVIPLRIVLACIPAGIAVSLAACVSPPTQEARSMPAEARSAPPQPAKPRGADDISIELRKFNVQSKDGNVLFKLGDLHCAHERHPKHGMYGDCNGIPVVVLENPLDGSCIAVHPYANLIIHSERYRTQVFWEIIGAKYYEFDKGQDGIAISQVTGTIDPTLPSDNYDRKQHMGRKWKWELRDDAKYPKTFYHLPNVVNTQTGKPCVPIDPGMINVLN